MRPGALTSNDFMNLYSGSNYSSSSSRYSSSYQKTFGSTFNSPKNEPQRAISLSTKLRDSPRYGSKSEKEAENLTESRIIKNKEASTPATKTFNFSGTSSGFYESERYRDERGTSAEPNRSPKNYGQSSSYRPSSGSPLSKSVYLKDATREDSNILTRKKRDIEITSNASPKYEAESRPYTAKYDARERYEESNSKKGTVSYYQLDEFLAKYSPSRSPTTATTQNFRYNNNDRNESSYSSLGMSKVMADNQLTRQTPTTMKSSSFVNDSGLKPQLSPASSSTSVKYNSFFDRQSNSETPKSQRMFNNIPQFEYKKVESRDSSEYSSTFDKNLLTRSEANFKKTPSRTIDVDTPTQTTNQRYSPDMNKNTWSQQAQNEDKPSLDSFITKVERGGPFPFKKFDDDFDNTNSRAKTPSYLNDDRTSNRDSPFKYSPSFSNRDSKILGNAPAKSRYGDDDQDYQTEAKKWGSKLGRSSSTRKDEESTDGSQDGDSSKGGLSNYYMSDLEKYLTRRDDKDYFSQIYREHFQQTFQSMKLCRYMKQPNPKDLAKKKQYLTKKDCYKNKKTIVFDLDETLIHCNDSTNKRSDVKLPIKFPHGEVIEAGINVRPYAVECLKELSQHFEIIVFTASHKCYADVVLNYLDPQKQYIQHRLYRDSCIYTEEGVYVKDLRVFANRDLKDLVLVDNAAYSFAFQLDNGIPIIPFYENKSDQELKTLVTYLKRFIRAKDVRDINKQTFKLDQYSKYNSAKDVLEEVISPNRDGRVIF